MVKCKLNKLISLFTALIMLTLCFAMNFSGSAQTDGSLTLICRKGNTILNGMNWRIYYVAQCSGNEYILNDDFKDYPVLIDKSSADVMNTAATTLENYAIVDQIPYADKGTIDEQGYLTFTNLQPGLYMVSGDIFNIEETFYQPSASLVEVNTAKDNSNVDLVVYPKVKYALLSEMSLNNTLTKVWKDQKTSHEPIDVNIFQNAELYKTVTLNDENNWTYSWESTEYAQWRVKEAVVPKDYVVNYLIDNGKFTIENTFSGIESPIITTTMPDVPKLPQTGQLWWPVIVMGSAGIILIISGIILKKRSKS